jgi:hypothetical protein
MNMVSRLCAMIVLRTSAGAARDHVASGVLVVKAFSRRTSLVLVLRRMTGYRSGFPASKVVGRPRV